MPEVLQDTHTRMMAQRQDEEQFAPIKEVLQGMEALLRHKNRKYGNSYANSSGTFSKASTLEKLLARADDKIARIRNSEELQRNDVADILGYVVLICANQGWNNFEDLMD